ncbi:hypothetical protein GJ744_004474 [Endocarpon pusillum]|uniref:Ubiquitin-like domain-containing protein n=1 Tax=Endocarpon pusillum TaxID=364733 RepID=A0A8H7E8C0_9EURO|nr:hypothetical protein GJ744_004474 [Endocarpon pusillum]
MRSHEFATLDLGIRSTVQPNPLVRSGTFEWYSPETFRSRAIWKDTLRKIQYNGERPYRKSSLPLEQNFSIHVNTNSICDNNGLDHKLDLMWPDGVRNDSLPEQLIEGLKGTRIHSLKAGLGSATQIPCPNVCSYSGASSVCSRTYSETVVFEKVEKREFLLENSQTGRPITLDQTWSKSFFPDDRVDMSMVFELALLYMEGRTEFENKLQSRRHYDWYPSKKAPSGKIRKRMLSPGRAPLSHY